MFCCRNAVAHVFLERGIGVKVYQEDGNLHLVKDLDLDGKTN